MKNASTKTLLNLKTVFTSLVFSCFVAILNPQFTAARNNSSCESYNITSFRDTVIPRSSAAIDSLKNLRQLPSRYFNKVNNKAGYFNKQLTKQTTKSLRRLQKQEEKINSKLSKIDSVAAHNLFSHSPSERVIRAGIDSLSHLQQLIKGKVSNITGKIPGGQLVRRSLSAGGYIPYLDTLQTTLNFLNKYSDKLSGIKNIQQKLQSSLGSVQQLEAKLSEVQNIQQYIQQRQQLLTQSLTKYGSLFTKNLGHISKEIYYYQARIKNYKALWQNPDEIEEKAIGMLNKVPAFEKFMQQNSILASLFKIPDNYGKSLAGLQTRSQVEQQIQQRLSGASPSARQAISQQMQQAQTQLNKLKDKFPGLNSTAQMPNFQPKELKSKTFLQRLQYGANVQFERANNIFPTISDIAAQIAYKFNEKGSAGIGASYKLGWGSNIQKLHFTSRGAGIRSFIDYKLKGTFFINGGFEFNYNSTIPKITALKDLNGWTRNAVIGIEKKFNVRAPFGGGGKSVKGTLILLYDFLHNQHYPVTPPLVLRTGYEF